jgi:hypothetical protein
MNNIFSILIISWLFTNLNAQTIDSKNSEGLKSNATKKNSVKGRNTLYLNYGYDFYDKGYLLVAEVYKIRAARLSSSGSFGLVYEHMINDFVGAGADISYSHTLIKYEKDGFFDGKNLETRSSKVKYYTIRAMTRFNFHFLESTKMDIYALLSIGYRSTKMNYTSNDPYFRFASADFIKFIEMPFGVKPGVGIRYFFSKNIGIGSEIALGAALINGGLNFRF